MPALPPVAGALRVRLLFTIGTKANQGIRYYLAWSGTAPTPAMLDTYGGDIVTAFSGAGRPQSVMNEQNELTGVILEDLTSDEAAVGEVGATVSGSVDSAALSADACVVQSLDISRRYRGGHPRTYWPLGSAADLVSNQAWSTTAVASFAAAIGAFATATQGITISGTNIGSQLNISYYQGFTPVLNPITGRYRNVPKLRVTPAVDDISSFRIESYVGSQRRRRNKISI